VCVCVCEGWMLIMHLIIFITIINPKTLFKIKNQSR
jgi:hypothetical protein